MANNVIPKEEIILINSEIDEVSSVQEDGDESLLSIDVIQLKIAQDACGERLDKVLSKLVPEYSRSRIQQWIEAGFVTLDGKTARIKTTVLGDEEVVIHPQPAPDEGAYEAEDIALDIIYEDDAIMVVNKPAGLVVHPAAGNWSGTLLNGLLFHRPELGSVPRAGIVHRLDKDTSGLMVVAKTMIAQTELVRQLQARTVKREYAALVWGTPNASGTVDAPMSRHTKDRLKMAVSYSIIAKPAITHFKRLSTGMLERFPVSLVACFLETGRTHQIRVHMQSLGFPLVGDTLYGKQHLARFFPRQALQARKLGLLHPSTGKLVEWEIPLAIDFQELLQNAGMPLP